MKRLPVGRDRPCSQSGGQGSSLCAVLVIGVVTSNCPCFHAPWATPQEMTPRSAINARVTVPHVLVSFRFACVVRQ